MPHDRVSYYLQRFDALFRERSHWNSQWDEAARRLVPAHKGTFHTHGKVWTAGQKNTQEMFDATASLALHRFQSVMESLATPSNQVWHRLVPAEDDLRKDRAVRSYLDSVNMKLYRQRYRAKAAFVGQNQKAMQSYGAYGNGLLWIEGHPEGGLRYKNLFLGQTYFLENEFGVIDTMYRKYQLTPRQIVAKFGDEGGVPESIFKLRANPATADEQCDILHCVFPKDDYNPYGIGDESMPYGSIEILIQEEAVLRESGYFSFPLSVSRYTQFSGEQYGRGPAQLVLPSIKLLNEQKKSMIKQAHRSLDPILLTHDDGMLGTFQMKSGAINPGGVTADGRPLVHTLPTGNLAVGDKAMEFERTVINDAFLVTLFQILTENPRMTATEVLERTREKGMLIAPTAGRLQAEYLAPMISREIDVLQRQGLIPEPPPILAEAGGLFGVEYDSPMSRMLRAENASGFQRSLETAATVAQMTGDISIMDHFDFDKAIPGLNDINGMPVDWTRSEKEVAAIRESRKQQAEQQMMMENAQGLAGAVESMNALGGQGGGGTTQG